MTTWFPIGPDFVFAPRDINFKRLSRHNELGRQGLVNSIAVDPADAGTIYIVETPASGGTGAFRSEDDGTSWTSIVDGLQQADPGGVSPSCIAVHPLSTGIVYLGTFSGRVYTSPTTKGATWNAPFDLGSGVFKLIVDPRSASNPATTVMYAAANNGVWRSINGGASFTQVLSGNLQALAARFPTDGSSADFYAGISRVGVFHAADPTGSASWTNLNTLAGTNLPPVIPGTLTNPSGNFDSMRIDVCRKTRRAYIWFFNTTCNSAGANCNEVTASLFTSANPTGARTQVSLTTPPGPAYGLYDSAFAIAPNSAGDGNTDILYFGSVDLFRSVDSGRTWADVASSSQHADYHAFAFFPDNPSGTTIPASYVGSDGGLGVSTRLADPAAVYPPPAPDSDQGVSYDPTSAMMLNYNHGKQSSAVYAYASDPRIAALGYVGCQDTGVNAGHSALGWRGIFDADGGAIAAAQGADGVKVWFRLGIPFSLLRATDRGEYDPAWARVVLPGGRPVDTSSNLVADPSNNCLAGVIPLNPSTSIAAPVGQGVQTVTPASMTFILNGSVLSVDGGSNNELVTVTAVTATSFTAAFAKAHAVNTGIRRIADTSVAAAIPTGTQTVTPGAMNNIVVGASLTVGGGNNETVTATATTTTSFTATFTHAHAAGASVVVNQRFVARIGQDAAATAISPDFHSASVIQVAVHPTSADQVFAVTSDQRLWTTSNATSASPSWTEISSGKPPGLNIASVAVDNAGNAFVLNHVQVVTGGGEFIVTSPLFLISGGNWIHVSCSNVPTPDITGFGRLVADPVSADTLYAGHDARVYALTSAGVGNNVTWTDISTSLPGQWIYDLWIGNLGNSAVPKVLLRAAIPTRGIWELDVTRGGSDSALGLYLRDNILDMGRLPRSPSGVASPYDPANPAATLFHYQCADIKIDALQRGTTADPDFFQTDPEGALPLSHVLFDQMRDNSDHLPGADSAMVHVQVHNRGLASASNVRVWAIYCNASAGVPSLAASPSRGNSFPFWNQFLVTGQVVPSLPADSPWRAIGPPQILSGIDPASPQVASWQWTVPSLPSGDPGHYCIAAFVHSSGSPINETGLDVDGITPGNRQIGQKNLHIGPPLPASRGDGSGSNGASGGPAGRRSMREYVEFHNPTAAPRVSSLVLDLRGVPPEIRTSFVLTAIDTEQPLPSSIKGIKTPGASHSHGLSGRLLEWLDRIEDELEETAGELLEWLGSWIEALGRRLEDSPRRMCVVLPDIRFERAVYTALPSARVEIQGVRLPAFGSAAALLSIENRGSLPPGTQYSFQVQQWSGGVLVGGSAYQLRISGQRERIPAPPTPEGVDVRELEELERQDEERRFLPPWIADRVDEAEERLGKQL
jgi:hypothetical protein